MNCLHIYPCKRVKQLANRMVEGFRSKVLFIFSFVCETHVNAWQDICNRVELYKNKIITVDINKEKKL